MTTEDRDAIAHRIRALQAKTIENGCTEEEALSAADAVRRLMDKHRLSQTDIEIEKEPIDRIQVERRVRVGSDPTDRLLQGVDRFCGVKTWFSNDGERRWLVIFGLRSDVEQAKYFYLMFGETISRATWAWYKDPASGIVTGRKFAAHNRRLVDSYSVGMAQRINERLIEMADLADGKAKTGSGTALVVVKNAVVEAAFKDLGLVFSKSSKGRRATDASAYYAGREAGNKVDINRPVGRNAARAAIA